MKSSVQFLTKFILASVVVFIFWAPLSRALFSLLTLETDVAFWLMGHPACLEMVNGQPQIHYLNLSVPLQPGQDVQIPIHQSIAIHLNVIILIALFVAVPQVSLLSKVKGLLGGIFLLSLSHAAHIYFLTHLFIWGYISQQAALPEMTDEKIMALVVSVESYFSPVLYPYVEKAELYWNSFLRETAPLVIWLMFVNHLDRGEAKSEGMGRQQRRQQARVSG